MESVGTRESRCTLTRKSDSEAIRSSSSLVALEAKIIASKKQGHAQIQINIAIDLAGLRSYSFILSCFASKRLN